jgi:hypothetical protein
LSRTLAEHKGPFALLTTVDALAESGSLVRRYGLEIVSGSCNNIRSPWPEQIVLCGLLRK